MSSDHKGILLSTKHLTVALLQHQQLLNVQMIDLQNAIIKLMQLLWQNLPQPMAAQQNASQAMLLHSLRSLPESGSILDVHCSV